MTLIERAKPPLLRIDAPPPPFCPSGYSPTIKGQLLHVDTTSSMQYRTLLEAEMLAVSSSQRHVWKRAHAQKAPRHKWNHVLRLSLFLYFSFMSSPATLGCGTCLSPGSVRSRCTRPRTTSSTPRKTSSPVNSPASCAQYFPTWN